MMLLKDVLRELAQFSGSVGLQQTNLYMSLFRDVDPKSRLFNDDNFDADSTVKKYFSGKRPLSVKLTGCMHTHKGFQQLCRNVRNNYLDMVVQHKEIYRHLASLIISCQIMDQSNKDTLLNSYDGSNADELARFIAACIVCGNSNTKVNKKMLQKDADVRTSYTINLSYMKLDMPPCFSPMETRLWYASQADYIASHQKGNRFHSLNNIIRQLLPSGYFTEGRFDARGRLADGTVAPLEDLCKQSEGHIAIVGEGGIGKTTFLQYLLQNEFMSEGYEPRSFSSGTIPFFVELNRCPANVAEWYNSSLQKTNFITRYIALTIENHMSLDTVSSETLDQIEKEFQRRPKDGNPEYLLLLDGFNEVLTVDNQIVRTYLSNEITVLSQYPNVRIITTSRETESAYYAADFENIYLVGLEEKDIAHYLSECGKTEVFIGEVLHCTPLMLCLRVPLYLCIFSAEEAKDGFLPETPGEILYCFFHRNSAFYNARQRVDDICTNPLLVHQTAFVLDFILPYVGWRYEESGVFSMNAAEFESAILDGLQVASQLFTHTSYNPFPDFHYNKKELENTVQSFHTLGDEKAVSEVINCVHAFMGIVYQYQVNQGPFNERSRYGFVHHQFRDYFSAIWDVQLLSMLQCIEAPQFVLDGTAEENTYHRYLNSCYWHHQKADFISQILMEHRNRLQLDTTTRDWKIPKATYDEQKVLVHALDFCRKLCQTAMDIHYLLQNILTAILNGRQELSGLDLRQLDFKHCSLFNVTCSRKGHTKTIAASFEGSRLYPENFTPEGHQDEVMEFLYLGNRCFTIDNAGLIKCWDVRSGKLEYDLNSEDPLGLSDFSSKGFMKISKDGRWLAAKVQKTSSDGTILSVNIFDLTNPERPPKQIFPDQKHAMLTFFDFTGDSNGLLILCDHKTVYCYHIETGKKQYCRELSLSRFSELYADSSTSPIYIFTADYSVYEEENDMSKIWEAEDEDDYFDLDSEDEPLPVLCYLYRYFPVSGKMEELYCFTGMPGTSPTAVYVPNDSYFLLFNYECRSIERFDCRTGVTEQILRELTEENHMPPSTIHIHPERPNEFYFMYPKNCYDVGIGSTGITAVLMKYSIAGVEKLLTDSGHEGELEFCSVAVPTNGRFIVANDTNTYEWDIVNESLVLKYNSAIYGCTSLLPIMDKKYFLLVHQHNGISVFGGNPPKLVNQICFHEQEYYLQNCCYSEQRNMLALTFYKPEHERVVLLDLTDSSQKIIFSTVDEGESVEVLCFSDDGSRLLITSQYRCIEYDLDDNFSRTVALSGDNERLAMAYYSGGEIEVAVTEHSAVAKPHVQTRCDFYRLISSDQAIVYEKVWYYIIPEMSTELYRYFIYQSGDLGITGAEDENGFQTCWITRGFFLEKLDELKNLMNPECYQKVGDQFVPAEKPFRPYDMICVRHINALAHQMRYGASGTTFMHLGDTLDDETVFSENTERLSYQPQLRGTTYDQLKNDFNRNIGGGNYVYWDFSIPWMGDTLIGCHSLYNLVPIEIKTGKLLDPIEYTPGIAIAGCNFRDVHADREIKELIANNGGIV